MKKIQTLFKREFEGHRIVRVLPEVTPGFEWVLDGEGIATVKWDGACCAVFDRTFWKRYDAKKGKRPPENAIACCDPDPVTGHWPHWVPVLKDDPADKWFVEAAMSYSVYLQRINARYLLLDKDATYEAVGIHFQGNPYKLTYDTLHRHGKDVIDLPGRSFDAIRDYLQGTAIEGIVFWKDGQPQCKIKRSDFGFEWPVVSEDAD